MRSVADDRVNSVWQRVPNLDVAPLLNAKDKRLRGLNKTVHRKSLIRFGDALPQQAAALRCHSQAHRDREHGPEFDKALAGAVSTAR